jgi:hypothetical protein
VSGAGPQKLTRGDFVRRAAGSGAALFIARASALDVAALAAGSSGISRFYSRPDLRPPAIEVVHRARGTAPGYLLLAPSAGPGQRGVLLADDRGQAVWFRPTSPQTAMNLRVSRYRGDPVLTWWEGKSQKGTGVGECVIVDASYREIARFKASNGLPVDLHEFIVTPHDTALVTSNEVRRMDLTGMGGGRRHAVMGGVVLELEIPTGRVLWAWHSLDHVPLAESHQRIGPRFDYFHINALDVAPDGNVIVSSRNTWTVYKVDRRTGAIMWRLGGKHSDFAMGPGTRFAWQHDTRLHDGGSTITIFDNGAAPPVEPQSRALVIDLDTRRMRASLAHSYVHDRPKLLARYTGSAQLLENGDMLVGWGSAPYFTEFARDGSIRFDARLPRGGQTYRALRFPWTGTPRDRPRVVLRPTSRGSYLYASWNGATEVAEWQLHTGASVSSLRLAGTVPRDGFETAMPVRVGVRHAQVVAVDRTGKELGRSAAIAV